MMGLSNAREREWQEWKAQFASADDRFQLQDVIQPKGSHLALIKIIWDPGTEEVSSA